MFRLRLSLRSGAASGVPSTDQATRKGVVRSRANPVPNTCPGSYGPGDTAVVVGPDPYVMADDPATPAEVIVHPGQRCISLDGEPLAEKMSMGVRTWGRNPDCETVILLGAYESLGEIGVRLLRALPPYVVLRADQWHCPCKSFEPAPGRLGAGGADTRASDEGMSRLRRGGGVRRSRDVPEPSRRGGVPGRAGEPRRRAAR
jgi:hypothetical protein